MDYFEQLKQQPSEHPRPAGFRSRRRVVSDIRPPAAPPAKPPDRESPPSASPTPQRPTLGGILKRLAGAGKPSPAAGAARPEPPPAPRELPIRTWEPDGARRARLRRRILAVLSAAVIGLGVTLPTFLFPRLTITITPKVETVAVPNVELLATTAATTPDVGARRIPAILIEAEDTIQQEYEATATKFFQERARGEVLVYNAYSSSPQSLVAGTRFQDSTGKVFRLQGNLTVPGAKIEEGKIVPTAIAAAAVADQPGAAANIGPTQFRIPGFRGTPKHQGFYAESSRAFSGGFVGEAKVVATDDLRRASEDLTRRAVEQLRKELDGKLPADPDLAAPEGAREVSVLGVESPKAGERAERFPVRVVVRGRLVAFRHSQATEVIAALLLPRDPALTVKPARAQPDFMLERARLGARPGDLRVTAAGELAFWREPNVEELTAILHTSTPAKAEAYLRGRDEIAAFRMKRFPRWLWYIPGRAGGLEIRVVPPA